VVEGSAERALFAFGWSEVGGGVLQGSGSRHQAQVNPYQLAVKLFAPKELKQAMNILKGKRTLLGILITQIPETWNALAPILGGLGMAHEAEVGLKLVGAIVAVLGFALKFASDDEPKG